MNPAQFHEIIQNLRWIQDGIWWCGFWLFLILFFKDCKGGKE